MRYRIVILSCLACVFAVIGIAVILCNKKIAAIRNENRVNKILLDTFSRNERLRVKYEGEKIDSIQILDSLINDVPPSGNGNRDYKLIMMHHPDACQSCMQSILDCFVNWLKQKGSSENVIILGNYSSGERIRIDRNIFGISSIFDIDEFIAEMDQWQMPYFFITDNDSKRLMNLYIPDANNVEQLSLYLSLMSDRFGI